jgi:hypothetical protein
MRQESDSGGNAVNGIGFALSSADLLAVLNRFYPSQAVVEDTKAGDESGRVSFASDDSGSEIYVDGKFLGQAPATISLPAGAHHVEIRAPGKKNWQRDLEVLKDSQLTLHPVLESSP